MYKVYYTYEEVVRTREKTGFSCKRYAVNKLVDEYETKEEALKHNTFENETADGYYTITTCTLEERKELPPKVVKPKEAKVDKKKKKK